jgi:hypothetical protein
MAFKETPEEKAYLDAVDPKRALSLMVRAIKAQKMIEAGELDPKLRKASTDSRAGREPAAIPSSEAIRFLLGKFLCKCIALYPTGFIQNTRVWFTILQVSQKSSSVGWMKTDLYNNIVILFRTQRLLL